MEWKYHDEKLNKQLKPLLKDIYKDHVKINDFDSRRNEEIVKNTVFSLVEEMKKVDPLFIKLNPKKKQIGFTGSYYERLKVKSPDEFDLNLKLRLPYFKEQVAISEMKPPSFTTLRFLRPGIVLESARKRELEELFDLHDYLCKSKLKSWLQSVMDLTLKSGKLDLPLEVVRNYRSSGPAFTLIIDTDSGLINVDIVPVIDCTPYDPPSMDVDLLHPEWVLVPKPLNDVNTEISSDRLWRISFPETEKKLLRIGGCVKMLIKLLKLLRDNLEWHNICSYYIKTLFLLEIEKFPHEIHWKEEYLGTLYLKMLCKLKDAVQMKFLPCYFDRRANLFENLGDEYLNNLFGRMKRVIAKIRSDPDILKQFYHDNQIHELHSNNYVPEGYSTPRKEQVITDQGSFCVLI